MKKSLATITFASVVLVAVAGITVVDGRAQGFTPLLPLVSAESDPTGPTSPKPETCKDIAAAVETAETVAAPQDSIEKSPATGAERDCSSAEPEGQTARDPKTTPAASNPPDLPIVSTGTRPPRPGGGAPRNTLGHEFTGYVMHSTGATVGGAGGANNQTRSATTNAQSPAALTMPDSESTVSANPILDVPAPDRVTVETSKALNPVTAARAEDLVDASTVQVAPTESATAQTTLAASPTVASVAPALLDQPVESDSGMSRDTAHALEQAPTGGSAPVAAASAEPVLEETLADHEETAGSTPEVPADAGESDASAAGGRPSRGGPRDWSSGRLIGSSFGPDMGARINRDWRTYSKHVRLEHARAQRDAQNQPLLDWFNRVKKVFGAKESQESASHLDWNLKTGGYGNVVGAPAKYSFDITTWNCSDVIYFTVDQNGSATSPNVIAITNPYATCPGNPAGATPTVKWGIRMTNGTATSAVPSLDGTVLYVLENRAAGVRLHAIKVNNITTNPGTYNFTTQVWANAHTLAAPNGTPTSEQLFELTFAGVVNNVASPYLDYSGNQIFFGDLAGRIRHVINTHLATASEDTTRFTNACGTSQLQSPVFYSNQVIVTSYNGYLYRLNTSGASPYTCIRSAPGGTGSGVAGALSPPIIDVTNDQIIVSTNDAAGFGVAGIGTMDVMFASGEAQNSAQMLGPSTTTAPMGGTFDDAFWSTGTGNFYAVAANSGENNTYLVRFPYNGSFGAPSGFAQLHRSGGGAVVDASPVTEFLTASSLANKDFVFVGGGGGSYLFMNRIGAGFAGTDAAPVNMANWFAAPAGVISQIIIDTRTAAMTGGTATANIYYGTMGVPSSVQSTIVQLAQQF